MSPLPKYIDLLKGSRCLVIGGTSGIGLAVAEGLMEEGARVFVASSTQDKVDATIKKLSDAEQQYGADAKRISGGTVNLKGPDMEKSIRNLFDNLPKDWEGKVDHVIHTAGDYLSTIPIQEVDYNSISDAGQIRFVSAILVGKVALDYWAPGGTYTITSGSLCQRPRPGWTLVAAYSAGLAGLTRALALDLGGADDRHIRVNCIIPGPVVTPMWDAFPTEGREQMIESLKKASLTNNVPSADIIAQSYFGVLKDTNVTGQTFTTDSGSALL